MAQTKMISYQRWRKRIANKGLLDFEWVNGDSLHRLARRADTLVLEKKESEILLEMTSEMFFSKKRKKTKSEDRLIQELKEMCKKQEIFRKNKVDRIRQQIKNQQYRIPGKDVVEKWFPEKPE